MSETLESPQPLPAGRAPLKLWVKVGYVLLGLSAPALLEIFFEVVLLTLSSGPQMLFYTITHTAGPVLGLILAISLLANITFAPYALGLLAYRSIGKLAESGGHFAVIMGCFAFQAVVFVLLFTYDYWAYALFR